MPFCSFLHGEMEIYSINLWQKVGVIYYHFNLYNNFAIDIMHFTEKEAGFQRRKVMCSRAHGTQGSVLTLTLLCLTPSHALSTLQPCLQFQNFHNHIPLL